MRLQLTCQANFKRNVEQESSMLMFTFHLGPLEIFCLAHLPRRGEERRAALVYVKVRLKPRTLVDGGRQVIEDWKMAGDEVRFDEEKESVSLGPLVVTRGGLSLRKRTIIDPKYKSIEDWKIVKGEI